MKLAQFILKLADMLKWTHGLLGGMFMAFAAIRYLRPAAYTQFQDIAVAVSVVALIVVAIDLIAKAIRAYAPLSYAEIPVYHHTIASADGSKGVHVHVFPDRK